MTYFIIQNGQQLGPFTIDELRLQPIDASTPVWAPGFSGWTTAGKVDELQEILNGSFANGGIGMPPPYTQQAYGGQQTYQQPNYNTQQGYGNRSNMPHTWLAESIIATILCCVPFGIVGIVYATKVSSLYQQGRYEEAERASRNAKTWTLVSVGVGLIVNIIILTGRIDITSLYSL